MNIKDNLAWIGACVILILITFFGTWWWESARKDKEFAALSGHKDSTMVQVNIPLPAKDTTVTGDVLPLKPSVKKELDSLRLIAKEYFIMINDTTDYGIAFQQSYDQLHDKASWLAQVFYKTIQDDKGKRKITADPDIKSINEFFYEDTLHVSVPQVTTTFTQTTGVKTINAIEYGFGGIFLGGAIADQNKTAMAVGAGGILLVELLKLIF